MSFDKLGLSAKVLAAVKETGYTEPTPIQEQAIPVALEGRDILGIAQTGTGKTAGFTLPMLTKLETGRARARMPRSLILAPTRELAAQVQQSFDTYGINHKLNVALLIGGVSFGDQEKILNRGADVLIATPGRLIDHFERGKVMLNGVQTLVIDEADRMLDMGFIPDIEKIIKLTPFTRQTLLFSATMPPEITRLTEQFLQNPVRVEVARASSTSDTIAQRLKFVRADYKEKRAQLRELMHENDVQNAIIFCNRKKDVAILEKSLRKHKFNVGCLHGDMDQHARTKTLDAFRNNEITYLVASDVAARGLDIPAVSHVFNFDVPIHAEDYVHRIGRTGRAGREGHAITLITANDQKHIEAITALIEQDIEWIGKKPSREDFEAKYSKGGRQGSRHKNKPGRDNRHKSETKPRGDGHKPRGEGNTSREDAHRHSKKPSKPDHSSKNTSKPEGKPSSDSSNSELPAFLHKSILG